MSTIRSLAASRKRRAAAAPIMGRMTDAIAAQRLVLAGRAAPATRGRDGETVRRYRLARLRVEGRASADDARGSDRPGERRYLHLKRVYD